MTDSFQGAILRCTDKAGKKQARAVWMLRLVAHVEPLEVPGKPSLLVVFERDIRDDDFEDGLGHALKSLGFVRAVEPIACGGFVFPPVEEAAKVDKYVKSLKPEAPVEMDDMADYLRRMRSWVRVRDAVLDATGRATRS